MNTIQSAYRSATEAIVDWREDLLSGRPPVRWPVGPGAWEDVQLGPGLIILLGGAPGGGKTALTLQWVIDALRLTPTLRALVANVEMSVGTLLDRQLARLSGVDLYSIRNRTVGREHAERLERGHAALDAVGDRLGFLRYPFDLKNVAAAADDFGADLILLDYVQRFAKTERAGGDRRASIDAMMANLREFADAGVGIIAVSAVGRQKDSRGSSSYANLNLASFRESSELEFGADSAYLIGPDPAGGEDAVMLSNPKNRHGEPRDIALRFNRRVQRFEPVAAGMARPDAGRFKVKLAHLWAETQATSDGGGDE